MKKLFNLLFSKSEVAAINNPNKQWFSLTVITPDKRILDLKLLSNYPSDAIQEAKKLHPNSSVKLVG